MLWTGQLLDCCTDEGGGAQANFVFRCSSDATVQVKALGMVHSRTACCTWPHPFLLITLACCIRSNFYNGLQILMQQLGAACLSCRADKELHAAAAQLIAMAAGGSSADSCALHAAQEALCQVLTNAVEVGH